MPIFLVKIVNILYSLGLHFECPKLLLWLGRLAMRIFEKISEFIGKWMAVVVLAIAALSLFAPSTTLWIQLSWVNYLLMVVMDPTFVGELPFDGRDVWHGAYAQVERFCAGVHAP